MREAALAWAARGFKVFRCLPGRKEPAGEGWRAEATDDALEIDALWGAKDYNVGVLCNDMIVVEMNDMIEGIVGGAPLWPTFRDAAHTASVVEAVLRSQDERRWVTISEVVGELQA